MDDLSRMAIRRLICLLSCVGLVSVGHAATVLTDPQATRRELYGASRLRATLDKFVSNAAQDSKVLAATQRSGLLTPYPSLLKLAPGLAEGFHLERIGDRWIVVGVDPSGVLYGCLELARRVRAAGVLPSQINVTDGPAFKSRGTNIFLFGDNWSDWPVTPAKFPWFYDRALMERYLDELVENRYNTIYFWTGHPFPYFLELPRYPEARMLGKAELRRNLEQLKWFTEEADRRGIWTVIHFYNLQVSPAFAKAHEHEGVHEENAATTPLLTAYMRYCVSEFVKAYPSVGVMLTAGEALNVKKEEFVRDAIIPGIKDSGKNPPLIVRAWWIDPYRYRDIIKPNYDNLYTMMKYNTEMLVSPYPDPRHKTWISFGQSHIINVHENADLKPFRWGSPVFIQQMVRNWKRIGVAGYHLYPMVSWKWPVSLDRVDPPLMTIERDRIWIDAFGRYGWDPDRSPAQEKEFWNARLAERFGSPDAGHAVYEFYVETGPILPGLQNLVNIYNMNFHPTAVSQEASLNGILHSDRWEGVGDYLARPLDDFTLDLYEKEHGKLSPAARGQPPLSVKEFVRQTSKSELGECVEPLRLSALFVEMAEQALTGLERAAPSVRREQPEYQRFLNDTRCILHLSRFYHAKIAAAIEKGLYDQAGRSEHYDNMLTNLEESVKEYAQLDKLATAAYTQATDLAGWFRWDTAWKNFEAELAFYREQASLARHGAEVVYLGLDGPMSNATNAFHWLVERYRRLAGWSAQSYCLKDNFLDRAKLVIVYDQYSPGYKKAQPQLEAWVRRGGKLLIWDPLARSAGGALLEGVDFQADSSWRPGPRFAYDDGAHPLIRGLSGTSVVLDEQTTLASSIREASSDWQELAYTVLINFAARQFHTGNKTFGPRWTSLMNPARVPLMLARREGAGTIVLAQLGVRTIPAKPPTDPDQVEEAPAYLRRLTENLIRWAE